MSEPRAINFSPYTRCEALSGLTGDEHSNGKRPIQPLDFLCVTRASVHKHNLISKCVTNHAL
jgi:hypothetical protein